MRTDSNRPINARGQIGPTTFRAEGCRFFSPTAPRSTQVNARSQSVSLRFFLLRARRRATHRCSRRATIYMSQQSSAIVAQPSSSAKALKRSATPRGRDAAAKKTKGLEHKLPWSCLDNTPLSLSRDFGAQQHLCKRSSTIMHYNRPKSGPTASHDIGKMVY